MQLLLIQTTFVLISDVSESFRQIVDILTSLWSTLIGQNKSHDETSSDDVTNHRPSIPKNVCSKLLLVLLSVLQSRIRLGCFMILYPQQIVVFWPAYFTFICLGALNVLTVSGVHIPAFIFNYFAHLQFKDVECGNIHVFQHSVGVAARPSTSLDKLGRSDPNQTSLHTVMSSVATFVWKD